MTPQYGLIISDAWQIGDILKNAPEKTVETAYGLVLLKMTEKWAVVCCSGFNGPYLMPHEYNSAANLAAFKEYGLTEVVGVHSAGSLRPSLAPGSMVIVDDWINFGSRFTTLSGQRRHLTPAFSRQVRQKLADAAWKAGVRFENGGTYWQTGGPRLETKAEIKLMSNFADLVGMGMADEANLAQEMGLKYGAICSVDNYANGFGSPLLNDDMIREQSLKNATTVIRLLEMYCSPASE